MKINVTVATLSLLGCLYFIYFYVVRGDIDGGSLGTLGDFIGGNLNPILTFITTILLIETLSLQRKATSAAEESAKKAEDTAQQQGLMIRTQIFESSFFNLVNLCLGEYKSQEFHCKGVQYSGIKAFYFVEKEFTDRKEKGEEGNTIIEDIDNIHGDIIYNTIKSLSSIFEFICNNSPDESRDRYITLAIKLSPMPVLYLTCIAKIHTDWPILKEFERAGIFEKKAFAELLKGYS
nr:hypothetical protein [Pseudomonas sp.]